MVAFDKTGTLTHGRPVVQSVIALDGLQPDQLLSLAASIERGSEHPIGRSIVQASQDRQIAVAGAADCTVLPGYGITGLVDSSRW